MKKTPMFRTKAVRHDKRLRSKGAIKKTKALKKPIFFREPSFLRWLLFVLTCVVLVFVLSPTENREYWDWKVGSIVPRSIYASRDFLVENPEATEEEREKAAAGVSGVYYVDRSVQSKIIAGQTRLFSQVKEESGDETADLSFSTQRLLKNDSERQRIREAVENVMQIMFERGIVTDRTELYPGANGEIIILDSGTGKEKEVQASSLFVLSEVEQWIEQRAVQMIPNRRIRASVVDIVKNYVQPTITFAEQETRERKNKARDGVPTKYRQVKKGSIIVRQGEEINSEHIALLKAMEKGRIFTQRGFAIGGISILVLITLAIVLFYLKNYHKNVFNNTSYLLLLSLIIIGTVLIARVVLLIPLKGHIAYLIPAGAGTILVAILLHSRLAFMVALLLAIFTGIVSGYQLDYLVVALISGVVAVFSVLRVRHRIALIKAGFFIGIANLFVVLGFVLLKCGSPVKPSVSLIVLDAFWGFGNGIVSALLAMITLPVFEHVFKITTDIQLLELADLGHPLLKRLAREAPGTYQGSLLVGNLAEVAADNIQANSLLARVGAYYHDVGKIKKPDYFTENQIEAKKKDRHGKLTASMSSLILISHVKEGVELAHEYRLPEEIIDIIKQHHGTTLTSFFYHRACEEQGVKNVSEENFRYPGPRPQAREAAIVLLADSVEAASRSLNSPTPQRLKELVRRIINDKIVDGQLDECNLTLDEIRRISDSFVRVLTGIFHKRIEYPSSNNEYKTSGKKQG